jgi:ribonucleoside-triphosphate reductase
MHNLVEGALEKIDPAVAKSYRDYRNYKFEFVNMLDAVYRHAQTIMYIGDKENSNTDSALVATKRSLIYNYLNKELYQKFFLNAEEVQACHDGFIYIHDMSARRDTMNCCLFDMGNVLKGGFEMGNLWYTEPKTLSVAFAVMSDVVLSTAAQQYGGFTIPEIDKILEPYAEKSYKLYYEREYSTQMETIQTLDLDMINPPPHVMDKLHKNAHEAAMKLVNRDMHQGFQGLEYKLNSVGSSRGDYPFVTITLGLATSEFGQMAAKAALEVHMNGQGKPDRKKAVLFPKIVFLYDEDLHGPGKPLESLFEVGIECSKKTMYPDWLSLSGDSYVARAYKKYGIVISPMGCRAFLSLWFERGGDKPADENDKAVAVGRWNAGAISLHLPLIYQEAKTTGKDFYKLLDYYLEMIRNLHIKTKEYLGNLKASINPVAFCEGGFYKGNLKPHDRIAPLLEYVTFSFGITALNELQQAYNGKSLVEDGAFALEVMEYINNKINKYKEADGILYAIYGTPAESLCGTQIRQFRQRFGIIKDVSDREYVSNSFHCHVTENITPIQKQDYEKRFWDLFNGGKIQYSKYPINYNTEAVKTIIRRAMKLGFYAGVNLSLSYCDDCGHEELNMDVCPVCGSTNLTKIDRMNGYLSYSRVHGDTRLNAAKMAEIAERKSM